VSIQQIVTDRLIIIPMNYSIVCSVLNGDHIETDKLGIQVSAKWPLPDTIDILNSIKDTMPKNNDITGFDVWMAVKKTDMVFVGDAGFKGEPDVDGRIEIGYGIIEEEQRKGYGYEIASSLMSWASKQSNVKTIAADCLLDNIGSIKILEKCGMNEIRRDHELIYWEKMIR